ncbi:Glyoxalase-like domain [Rhizoctonia solani]|uniref:Glyoxalase-like domain n=1 Tax=Rhizoctonia solani TaxID=456999 RepID=A0A8H7I4T5_9AGAM|nr:Glyoxalase-like domain [Rhizoctonia solani]
MAPPTNILDHIVHLSPAGKLPDAVTHWERLGFKVTPGGTHAGGLTSNALVALADGVYIELIAFEQPPTEPPASDDRWQRNRWVKSGVKYQKGKEGGRKRASDGKELKWRTTAPKENHGQDTAPFFCQDLTPRDLRVPQAQLDKVRAQISVVLYAQSNESDEWELAVPHGQHSPAPRLKVIGSADATPGIVEVGFYVKKDWRGTLLMDLERLIKDYDHNGSPTNILDHIIHLSPPGKLSEAVAHWENLGFHVIPGGTHADGLTSNALVALADGVYIELIAFEKPPIGPPASDHWWAKKQPGWIDWACLGLEDSVDQTVAGREKGVDSGVEYQEGKEGGRKRASDGKELKWRVTFPQLKHGRGTIPFFCQDLTPRELRVPAADPDTHTNSALGIAYLHLTVPQAAFDRIKAQLSVVLGTRPNESDEWELAVPYGQFNPRTKAESGWLCRCESEYNGSWVLRKELQGGRNG